MEHHIEPDWAMPFLTMGVMFDSVTMVPAVCPCEQFAEWGVCNHDLKMRSFDLQPSFAKAEYVSCLTMN